MPSESLSSPAKAGADLDRRVRPECPCCRRSRAVFYRIRRIPCAVWRWGGYAPPMVKGFLVTLAFISLLGSLAACGGNSGSSPISPTPSVVQVGGLWNASVTLTSATGGECVGALYASSIGGVTGYSLSISQTGSSLTATSTSRSDGSTIQYTGTAGRNTITLNATNGSAFRLIGIRCSNGAIRDSAVQTLAVFATISGNSATGTYAQSSNVYTSGTTTGVGTLALNASFLMTR